VNRGSRGDSPSGAGAGYDHRGDKARGRTLCFYLDEKGGSPVRKDTRSLVRDGQVKGRG